MKPNPNGRAIARAAIPAAILLAAPCATAQTTQNFPDGTGEVAVPGNPFPHLDITSVDVTVDAAETNITFRINLSGSPVATNWGKYLVAIRSGVGGTTTGNGWGRPINFTPGMTHWIGSWVDGVTPPASGNVFTWSGTAWASTANLNGTNGTVTRAAGPDYVEITTAVANLGLAPGETFSFDVYTTGGGGSDGAVDALSSSTASINNWGDTYTTNALGSPTAAALTFTMPGTATDTDGDGLSNTAETNTGTYVNSSNTGTDPNNPDTDGDGLTDGDEVNIHSTNPTLADSDADGANDRTELSLGTNPNSGPVPSGGDTAVIGFEHFDYADGGINNNTGYETRVFDFDNSTANDSFLGHTGARAPWTTSFGTRVIGGRLLTDGSNAVRAFNGPATGGNSLGRVENIAGLDAKVVYARIDLSRLSGATFSGLSFVNGSTEVAFAGVRDALNAGNRNFGVEITGEAGSAFTGDVPVTRVPNTIVAKLDTQTASISLWVDPDLSGTEPTADAEAFFTNTANAAATGIRIASGGRALWDDLIVATEWAALENSSPTNTDADGLRDSWENIYAAGNLTTLTGTGNSDSDTLTNAQEQGAGSSPLVADTDADGLNDNIETNTATLVGPTNTGTDPAFRDSDDDTLSDGSEVSIHATNPNIADSDGDLENDGFEVFQGTDPNDAGENSTGLGLVQVNGNKDALYGAAASVQTVQTGFGDNQNELNAAYARVQDGKLYLLLTGNLQDNFNKLEIFIDANPSTGVFDYVSAGNDNTTNMEGMVFDDGFEPEFHLIARRGDGKFDLDISNLLEQEFSAYSNILSFGTTGYGSTGTGTVNASPIRVAYDNSNTGGIGGGSAAADSAAALAVSTGLELCIDLADLGSPTGDIRIAAMINNTDHNYLSNQVLGGLPAGTGNLGGDGAGNFTGNLGGVDFTNFAGDQFFVVSTAEPASPFRIAGVAMINGGTQLQITVEGLTSGNSYQLTGSTNLSGFSIVNSGVTPAQPFTATAGSQVITVNVTPGTQPKRFFRLEDAP
ncbi:MAG: thrombospondin type 3 repeat-containing protein [Akkermansiaceae bacterium]|jgi:hypothetical protein|nr:thrombospondin type 3 repeat-containing protein [Akkermansiaceae bacterium]